MAIKVRLLRLSPHFFVNVVILNGLRSKFCKRCDSKEDRSFRRSRAEGPASRGIALVNAITLSERMHYSNIRVKSGHSDYFLVFGAETEPEAMAGEARCSICS